MYLVFFKINLFILFIYFWLCWVFVAARWLSLQLRRARATLCCGARASHCGGFSCCRARALGTQASVIAARGLSSCGLRALECRLSSCGARAQLLQGMWDLPGPGLEPMSPALAGGFLTTAPPGKPCSCTFYFYLFIVHYIYFYLFSFLATPHSLWDLSSLTRDRTQALSSESTES